jgi:mannose-6-phosphate isomerase-like protein (cupin superfamily)
MIFTGAAGRAVFSAEKMGKVSLGSGEHLYAGLNCFEAGQQHAAHVHGNQDKLYVVLEGEGEASVGEEVTAVKVGDVVLAPAGVPHGLRNPGNGRLVVLVVFGPPPRRE